MCFFQGSELGSIAMLFTKPLLTLKFCLKFGVFVVLLSPFQPEKKRYLYITNLKVVYFTKKPKCIVKCDNNNW